MSGIANFVAWALAQPDTKPVPASTTARYGAGSRTGQVLAYLGRGADKTISEIAAAIGVTPGAMYQVITAMAQKNLIVSRGERNKCKTWRAA
jgi:DNA-binding MarR family transcriptional regulator